MTFHLLVDRPGLAAQLALRDIARSGDDAAVVIALIGDGESLVALRRDHPTAAILALVPDDAAEIALLDAGADDAMPASSSDARLAARVAALLARIEAATMLRFGDLAIDRVAHRATRAGRPLALLPREYALLLHFARHPGVTVTRPALLEAVWGLDFDPGTNVIEVHVSRLRAKLDRGFAGAMLVTDKGRGYRFIGGAAGVAGLARAS